MNKRNRKKRNNEQKKEKKKKSHGTKENAKRQQNRREKIEGAGHRSSPKPSDCGHTARQTSGRVTRHQVSLRIPFRASLFPARLAGTRVRIGLCSNARESNMPYAPCRVNLAERRLASEQRWGGRGRGTISTTGIY